MPANPGGVDPFSEFSIERFWERKVVDDNYKSVWAYVEEEGDYYLIDPDPCSAGSVYRVDKVNVRINQEQRKITCGSGKSYILNSLEIKNGTPCIRMEITPFDDKTFLNSFLRASPEHLGAPDSSNRVQRAKDLLAAAHSYPKGCSGFVCDVLEIPWESANDLMGSSPVSVGDNNVYTGLNPGDIAGWKATSGSGHVTVYIGEPGMKFIDVRSEGDAPRKVGNGYGNGRPLFKSLRF